MFVSKLDKAVGDDELAALFAHIGGICSATVMRHEDNKSKKWGYYYYAITYYLEILYANANDVTVNVYIVSYSLVLLVHWTADILYHL